MSLFFKCVVTEVVLFSIVALKTLNISQGSVATHLRCDGIFSDSIIILFLLILTVKYEGRPINKLQNGIILLIFKI